MNLYLLFFDPDYGPKDLDFCGDGIRLRDGLYLIQSELTRSKLYHRIKWQLKDGAALLVAPLADDPKFKGMEAGSLKWLRDIES